MQDTLRVGVVGLGLIGSLHARIFWEMSNAELVAVSDVNREVAETIAFRYGCVAYTDFQEMCDKAGLNAVAVCTPDQFHLENALYAAKRGLNLLIEKPIAPTEAEARQIEEAAKKAGIRVMVAHILHFDPRYAQLEEAIKRGDIGNPIHMYFRRTNPRSNARRLGGKVSIFYFIGVHDFEMMCAYMHAKPTRVYSQQVKKVHVEIGCEDTTISLVNFDNGALGLIELCWALPENNVLGINTYVEVVGEKAAGYVNIMDQGISIITEDKVLFPDTLHWPEYNGRVQGDLKEELQHFVTATLSGDPYLTKIENAIIAVKIIEACFVSIKAGKPIDINC
jgi:UDP-N-acetylglucosamine 3-dehydrogenase